MVSPIDYTIDVQSPFQAAMQGWAMGTQDKLARAEEARRQQMFDQQQAAMQQQQIQQQQFALDKSAFASKPNKTRQDFVDFQLKYPEVTEPYKKTWEMKSEGERQSALGTAAKVMSAIKSGYPNIAQDILEEQAVALENTGDKEGAFNSRRMKSMISKDPNSIYSTLGLFGNAVSPDEFGAMMDKFGAGVRSDQMQPYEIAKTQAETGKIKAETQGQTIENQYKPQQLQSGIEQTQSQTALNNANIRNLADRLRLDQDKLQSDIELKYMELNPSNIKLSDGAQKIVNDNMVESVGLEQSANKMDDLANRFEKESQAGGLYTKGWAGFKRITGWSNDDQNAMIREYSRLRNSEAIKSLPPGPATDRDIELALRGLPPETADSTTLTSFLRGYAKLNRMDSAYKQMQAEWVNQVGNMGSNKRDVEVLGVKVPAGTTFSGYASKNLDKTLKHQADQAIDRQIATGQRSYMSAVQ